MNSIFARNCTVRRIDKDMAQAFLAVNHRFGWCKCRYCYGLFVRDEVEPEGGGISDYPQGTLVAVSTFSNARRWQKGDRLVSSYEWLRYASLPDLRVIGGMGKTLDAFERDLTPDDIMSYAPLTPSATSDDSLSSSAATSASSDGSLSSSAATSASSDGSLSADSASSITDGDVYLKLGFTLESIKSFPSGLSAKFRKTLPK